MAEHPDAAPPRTPNFLTWIVAWVIPGGGHVLLGRTGKGIFFFALLLLTFLGGLVLADFRTIKPIADNPFYFIGHFGSGMSLGLTHLLSRSAPRGLVPSRFSEAGLLYMSVAGLLNVLVMMSLNAPTDRSAPPAGKKEGLA
ncbi:MAG: hypothetical protein HYZ53_01870 [Planctomycetes bacterium]|nr:hypothetical protein [Planctomycetota bacterium]